MLSQENKTYLDQFSDGEPLAAARLMSVVERGGEAAELVLDALFPRIGTGYRVGITGSTGSGKSTLVNALTFRYRETGQSVGIIAEDPTSPFTGGAILGDRIRMHRAIGDAGVFVRSIASRGSETGFSSVATELADVLDAFGRDIILMETIGVGQLEHRIRFSADTTVVVLTPESGDEVQSLKSGLMEVGDVFVINKSDRPQAHQFARDIEGTLDIRYADAPWKPPVVETVASEEKGAENLVKAIGDHRAFLLDSGTLEMRRQTGLRNRIRSIATEKIGHLYWENAYIQDKFDAIFKEIVDGNSTPYAAAARLAKSIRVDGE